MRSKIRIKYFVFSDLKDIAECRGFIKKKKSPPGPDKQKLRELLKDKAYRLTLSAGQRRYGARPQSLEKGHQLVVNRIPREWFEDKLIPLFQEFGKIYEVLLLIDKRTGYNRGFCFVSYYKKEDTEKAHCMLNKYGVHSGKTLKANFSSLKTRLLFQNIPRNKSAEELKEDFGNIAPGVKDVVVSCTPEMLENNIKNRGYCFVEYETHKQALRVMFKLKYEWKVLLGYKIAVQWYYPPDEPDEEYMSKVKVVYVKNLTRNTKIEDLKTKFEEFGVVERVNVVRDLGFVHFEKREDALKAIEEMNGTVFGNYEIICCLSKPKVHIGTRRKRR
ncbi:hypothetical protein ACJMK2_024725 [Sinanodonta woodiana]|uniref:RRM domain-containing protein n=1 Tax=Sinanodonta woodiana TaxID=1069815 RepID=A0ABD3XE93_SINWO